MGRFDPTATSNAVTLLQGMANLPVGVDEMFAHFVRDFAANTAVRCRNNTAYEIRRVIARSCISEARGALSCWVLLSTDDPALEPAAGDLLEESTQPRTGSVPHT